MFLRDFVKKVIDYQKIIKKLQKELHMPNSWF
jgi:hypothetical protein